MFLLAWKSDWSWLIKGFNSQFRITFIVSNGKPPFLQEIRYIDEWRWINSFENKVGRILFPAVVKTLWKTSINRMNCRADNYTKSQEYLRAILTLLFYTIENILFTIIFNSNFINFCAFEKFFVILQWNDCRNEIFLYAFKMYVPNYKKTPVFLFCYRICKFSQFLNFESSLPKSQVNICLAFILALTMPLLLYHCWVWPPSS